MNHVNDLTVFIITSGNNPCFPECYKSIKHQTVNFNLRIIKDISPMSRAFQKMIDFCETDYYIEIDEDMVLNENAIEVMYREMKSSSPKTAIHAFRLLDVHPGEIIFGVKIYRHTVLKNYPYDLKTMSCEVEQISRMQKDGFELKYNNDVVGKHAPVYDDQGIFGRYLNLMEKFKVFKYRWIENLPKYLFEKVKKHPSDQNIYALLGAFTGLSTEKNLQINEKNFLERYEAFDRFKSYCFFPTEASIYVTYKCNFQCNFCLRRSKDFSTIPDATTETAQSLLFRFPSLKSVCLAGFGEPFLNQNLFYIIQFLKSMSIYTGVITNGSLICDRRDELRDNPPSRISISLNAINEEKSYQINKARLFNKMIEGVRICSELKINTTCSFVCTKQNINDVPEFLKLATSLGANHVDLINMLPHNFATYDDENFWNTVLTVEDKEKINYIKSIPESKIVSSFPRLLKRGDIRYGCFVPWKSIGIEGGGNLTFCSSVFPPSKEQGNIKDFNIWHNDYVTNLRKSFCDQTIRDECKMCFRNYDNRELNIPEFIIDNSTDATDSVKLKICKIIDQFGWAYYFVTKEQQRYSSHNIIYRKIADEKIEGDILYLHSANLGPSVNERIDKARKLGMKVIGGYGGEVENNYKDADIIVSISFKFMENLKKRYPNKIIAFLPESVDTKFFINKHVRQSDSFNVGWAGRLGPDNVKRPYLLDKFKYPVTIKSDWGEDFFKDERSQDDMLDFYNSIDVLILISSSECMPRVVLEAMACGLPVISTDVGSVNLLLEKDWIIPNYEEVIVEKMNNMLDKLKNDTVLRTTVGKRNRDFIEKYFSWEKNQKLWDDAFLLVKNGNYKTVEDLGESFIKLLNYRKEKDRLISVNIHVHNRDDYLERVLVSLKEQSYGNFEVNICETANLESTIDIVKKYARSFKINCYRLHLKYVDKTRMLNFLAKKSHGEIICICDADVLKRKDYLKEIDEKVSANIAVVQPIKYVDGFSNATSDIFESIDKDVQLNHKPKSQIAVEKEVFEFLGGYDEKFFGWGYEDEDLFYRLQKFGTKIISANSYGLHLNHDKRWEFKGFRDEKLNLAVYEENKKRGPIVENQKQNRFDNQWDDTILEPIKYEV